MKEKKKETFEQSQKEVTDQRLFNLFRDVCEKIAGNQPEDAYIYRRLAEEPYHCDGFPVSLMIGTLVWDHVELFAHDVETVAYALRMFGGLADYRLPLMSREREAPEATPDEDASKSPLI